MTHRLAHTDVKDVTDVTDVTDAEPLDEATCRVLDATGLSCPEPLMLLRGQMRKMAAGERIRVMATDPSTHRDFSDYCRFLRHELLYYSQDGEVFEYVLEKGGS